MKKGRFLYLAILMLVSLIISACGSGGDSSTTVIEGITVSSTHNPIAFVHGWAGSASDWNTMKQNFINAGWPSDQLFAISLSNSLSGDVGINITHAGEIRDYINDTVLPQTGANRVDIIAFSMGGLATMYYLHALNGATRWQGCRRCVPGCRCAGEHEIVDVSSGSRPDHSSGYGCAHL